MRRDLSCSKNDASMLQDDNTLSFSGYSRYHNFAKRPLCICVFNVRNISVFNFRNIRSSSKFISLTNFHTYFLRHPMDHRKTLRFRV